MSGLLPGSLKDLMLALLLCSLLLHWNIQPRRMKELLLPFLYDIYVYLYIFEILLFIIQLMRRFKVKAYVQALVVAWPCYSLLNASLGGQVGRLTADGQGHNIGIFYAPPEMLLTLYKLSTLLESMEFSAVLEMKDEALHVAHTLLQPTRNIQHWSGNDVKPRYLGGTNIILLSV